MFELLSLAAKAGLYVGALGAGGLGAHRALHGAEHRKWITSLALMLASSVVIRLLLMNAELAGGLGKVFDFTMFDWLWAPNRNQTLAYVSGVAVLMVSTVLHIRTLYLIGAILVFAGAGLGGHTHALETPGINPILVSAHVAIAAFWTTAPLVLWPHDNVSDDELRLRVQRFSQIAVWCVPLLFAAGFWLAWRLSGSLETLIGQTYGRLLLAKLLLASVALALGAFNKFRVAKRLEEDAARGRVLLRRTLGLETVIFAGIVLAIAAATSLTGPGA